MPNDNTSFWSTLPGVLAGLGGVIVAITGLYAAFNHKSDPVVPPASFLSMGPLEHGWNYDHNDLNANGWLSITSAEACSDLCYTRKDCKAMTYVVSNKSCWLKYAVPTATQNADMISAVRRTQ